MSYIVTTFYKFVDLSDVNSIHLKVKKFCNANKMLGTILLAKEGINGTIVASQECMKKFYDFIKELNIFGEIDFKENLCPYEPFSKMKVKIKPEIVTFKVEGVDSKITGKHLKPKEWEELLDSGALVIDTRNDYEVAMGTFKNAIDPKTRNFTDLVEWVDKNLTEDDKEKPIGMFCTGGVRCEKSTAFMLKKGFKNVYHLEGGIIKYLIEAENKDEYWKGQCFVFDDRVAINSKLEPFADAK